jgi:hypothetical protein
MFSTILVCGGNERNTVELMFSLLSYLLSRGLSLARWTAALLQHLTNVTILLFAVFYFYFLGWKLFAIRLFPI